MQIQASKLGMQLRYCGLTISTLNALRSRMSRYDQFCQALKVKATALTSEPSVIRISFPISCRSCILCLQRYHSTCHRCKRVLMKPSTYSQWWIVCIKSGIIAGFTRGASLQMYWPACRKGKNWLSYSLRGQSSLT